MPDWARYVRQNLLLSHLQPEREAEIVEDLAEQLGEAYAEALRLGLNPQQAEAAAMQHVVDWGALARELVNSHRGRESAMTILEHRVEDRAAERGQFLLLTDLWQDIRYGLRMLRKSPGFTVAAVIALAFGIGANTGLFSVVNGVLLRPLPYRDPNNLVVISLLNHKTHEIFPLCDADFLDWREQNRAFSSVAAFSGNRFNITGFGAPEQVLGDVVTADFFSTLGVTPVLGRTFLPHEDRPGSPRVAVLSYGLWQGRFGSSPSVIGHEIVLNGSNYTVIGVMPRSFVSSREIQLWANLVIDPPSRRGPYYLTGEARLKPGVTLEQARAELSTIARRIEQQNPLTNSNISLRAVLLEEAIVGDVRPALLVLLGAVAFVLLIASANVANLMLARGSVREREVAIRSALGASRARLTTQLLTESVLLAAIGGLSGLLLAGWGVKLLLKFGPSNLPRLEEVTIDARVLAFTCVVSLVSGILFGLVPAVEGGRSDLNKSLKEGGRSAAEGQHRSRARSVLVVVEIALSLILLIGGGLMLKSFHRLQTVSSGVNADNGLTMQISLPRRQYDVAHMKKDSVFR